MSLSQCECAGPLCEIYVTSRVSGLRFEADFKPSRNARFSDGHREKDEAAEVGEVSEGLPNGASEQAACSAAAAGGGGAAGRPGLATAPLRRQLAASGGRSGGGGGCASSTIFGGIFA